MLRGDSRLKKRAVSIGRSRSALTPGSSYRGSPPSGFDMSAGKKRKTIFLGQAKSQLQDIDMRKLPAARKAISKLQDLLSDFPASESVDTEGDTSLHGAEDESEAQQRPKKLSLSDRYLLELVEELLRTGKLGAEQKNQLDTQSSSPARSAQKGLVEEEPSTQLPPEFPLFPEGAKPEFVLEWRMQCQEIRRARKNKGSGRTLAPQTLRAPKDPGTADAVQDWRSKQTVVAAARSVVSVTPISDGKPTKQFTGFVLGRYEHSGFVFSVMVTCSRVLCNEEKRIDPLPKLSVGLPDKKTVIEAQLLCFNHHFDIAFLLLPHELSLYIPCLGGCPDYNQEVFVLGRDMGGSLRVRHGMISWTEESDFIGRDHCMFIDGEVPEGGTGGPVIDHDGVFRGMAFNLSPEPAVLSISTIMTCLEMFRYSGRIARPMLGLNLRTLASVDVELLESLSHQNIKSGYIVEVVPSDSPARGYGICRGNVIVSLNDQGMLALPKLEDYLLSLGWKNLISSASTVDIKLEVCDLKGQTKVITMPVKFA